MEICYLGNGQYTCNPIASLCPQPDYCDGKYCLAREDDGTCIDCFSSLDAYLSNCTFNYTSPGCILFSDSHAPGFTIPVIHGTCKGCSDYYIDNSSTDWEYISDAAGCDCINNPNQCYTPPECSEISKTYPINIPPNYYIYPLSPEAPASASGQICYNDPEYSPVRISNKIKISVPNDPIFSGVYIFDRCGLNDWKLNNDESIININSCTNPSDPSATPSYLINFTEVDNPYDISTSEFYEEKYEKYNYDGLGNNSGDIYSFPAKYYMCITQAASEINPIGHRLSVGFTVPIRYRPRCNDWVVVDRLYNTKGQKTPHAISGSPNYAYYETPTVGSDFQPKYTFLDNGQPTCSGLNNLGFSFKCEGYLLGSGCNNICGGYPYISTPIDETSWFTPKIPVLSQLEFVYDCREECINCDIITYVSTNWVPDNTVSCYGSIININYNCNLARNQEYILDSEINIYFITSNKYKWYIRGYEYSSPYELNKKLFYGTVNGEDSYYIFNLINNHVSAYDLDNNKYVAVDLYWVDLYQTGQVYDLYIVPSNDITVDSTIASPVSRVIYAGNKDEFVYSDNDGEDWHLISSGDPGFIDSSYIRGDLPAPPIQIRIQDHYASSENCDWVYTYDPNPEPYNPNRLPTHSFVDGVGVVNFWNPTLSDSPTIWNVIESMSTGLSTNYISKIFSIADQNIGALMLSTFGFFDDGTCIELPGISVKFYRHDDVYGYTSSIWYNYPIYSPITVPVPPSQPISNPFSELIPGSAPLKTYADRSLEVFTAWRSREVSSGVYYVFAATYHGLAKMQIVDETKSNAIGGIYSWIPFDLPGDWPMNNFLYINDVDGDGDTVCVATNDGLQMSSDLGDTWTKILDTPIKCVKVYDGGQTILAGSIGRRTTESEYYSNAMAGIYISDNGGATFKKISNSPTKYVLLSPSLVLPQSTCIDILQICDNGNCRCGGVLSAIDFWTKEKEQELSNRKYMSIYLGNILDQPCDVTVESLLCEDCYSCHDNLTDCISYCDIDHHGGTDTTKIYFNYTPLGCFNSEAECCAYPIGASVHDPLVNGEWSEKQPFTYWVDEVRTTTSTSTSTTSTSTSTTPNGMT